MNRTSDPRPRRPRPRRAVAPVAAAALVLASFATPGSAPAKDVDVDWSESWPVGETPGLVLVHGDGDVRIVPGEDDEITVDVVYRASTHRVGVGSDREFRVEASRDGDTIRIETIEVGASGPVILAVESVEEYRIDVSAPPRTVLHLTGDDGDVRIDGWRGPIALRGEDGDVWIAGTASDARITVDDGDVEVIDSAGSWMIRTEDGDVRMDDLAAAVLQVETDDGDVRVSLVPTDELDGTIRTADGDVTVDVPADNSIGFRVDTDDGHIDVSLRSAREVDTDDDGDGVTIPGKTGSLRIATDDGDIRLRER